MPIPDVQLGVIGLEIEIPLTEPDSDDPLDLTGVDEIRIYLKPRRGEVKERAGVVSSPATDGICTYTTVDGDIDEVGKWKAQARPIFSADEDYPSSVEVAFEVEENLYGPE